jgi:hypothetical protein
MPYSAGCDRKAEKQSNKAGERSKRVLRFGKGKSPFRGGEGKKGSWEKEGETQLPLEEHKEEMMKLNCTLRLII